MNNCIRRGRLERGGLIRQQGIFVVLLHQESRFKSYVLGSDGVLVAVRNWESNKFCNTLGLYDISCASSVVGQRWRIGYSKKQMCVVGFYVLIESDRGGFFATQGLNCLYLVSYQ